MTTKTGNMLPRGRKLSASLEDYLEAIFHIVERKSAARAKDIADRVGVNRSSVTGALHMLSDKGLVNYAPYDVVTLTASGQAVAADVVKRHNVLSRFFEGVLGVEAGEAEEAACRMEHAAPRGVVDRLVAFADFVASCPRAGADWIEAFMTQCESGQGVRPCDDCLDDCVAQWRRRDEDRSGRTHRPG